MKLWLIVLALMPLMWNAEAKETCTLSKTLFAPAKNNRCFDQLVADTKNADDRKWLLEIKNNWKPANEMNAQAIVGGYNFYEGKKFIGSFQWMSISPPILYTNGEIKIGQKNTNPSLVKTIQSLLHNKSTAAYFYQSMIPTAEAQQDQLSEAYITLFSLYDKEKSISAKDLMSEPWYHREHLPIPKEGYIWDGTLTFNCTPEGVENVEFKRVYGKEKYVDGTEKKFTVTQKSKNEFVISGILGNEKVLVTYRPNDKEIPCSNGPSFANSDTLCKKAWDEFFAQNPDIHKTFKLSNVSLPNCARWPVPFNSEEISRCNEFFNKKFEIYTQGKAEDKEYSPMKYSYCANADCSKAIEFKHTRTDRYIAFMKKRGYDVKCQWVEPKREAAHNDCDLPDEARLKLTEQDRIEALKLLDQINSYTELEEIIHDLQTDSVRHNYTEDIVNNAVQGTALIGNCCKDPKCRDAAKKNQNLILKPATAPKTQK